MKLFTEATRFRVLADVVPTQVRQKTSRAGDTRVPKLIGWLDMLRAAGASGVVTVEVLKEGDSILLARPLGTTTMWRQVDSDNPQHWVSEAAKVWQELQVEGSTFRSPEFQELDS